MRWPWKCRSITLQYTLLNKSTWCLQDTVELTGSLLCEIGSVCRSLPILHCNLHFLPRSLSLCLGSCGQCTFFQSQTKALSAWRYLAYPITGRIFDWSDWILEWAQDPGSEIAIASLINERGTGAPVQTFWNSRNTHPASMSSNHHIDERLKQAQEKLAQAAEQEDQAARVFEQAVEEKKNSNSARIQISKSKWQNAKIALDIAQATEEMEQARMECHTAAAAAAAEEKNDVDIRIAHEKLDLALASLRRAEQQRFHDAEQVSTVTPRIILCCCSRLLGGGTHAWCGSTNLRIDCKKISESVAKSQGILFRLLNELFVDWTYWINPIFIFSICKGFS